MFVKTKEYGLINLNYIRRIHKMWEDEIALIAKYKVFPIKFRNSIQRDKAYDNLTHFLLKNNNVNCFGDVIQV